LKTSVTHKNILQLALPIYGGLIASQSIIIADIFFLGRVDSVQQSAAAFAGVFYMVFFLIGYGFTQGAQILIARRIGENRLSEVGKLFWNTILVSLFYAIAVAVFFKFESHHLFRYLLDSEDVANHAADYISTRSFGILGSQIAWCFTAYNIGRGNSVAVTIASVVNALVNIILAYMMIFGHWGMPKMEIKGAALASAIADLCTTATYVIYMLINKDYKTYAIQKFSFLNGKYLNQIFKVSFPLIVQSSLSIIAWFLFFAWIENTGKINFEVSMIVRGIYSVFLMSPIAMASATNSIVSNLIGQKRHEEVIPLVYKVVKMSFIYVLIVCPVLLIFPDFLMSVFTQDVMLIPLGRSPLIAVFLAMLFFSISSVMFQAVSGTGNTMIALVIETICIALYLLYTYVATDRQDPMGLPYIWLVETFYMLGLGVLSAVYLHSNRWKTTKI